MSVETVTQSNSSAGITAAAPWRMRAVSALPDYRLSVTCNDGTSGIVDMSQLVTSHDAGVFAALADENVFGQARIELGVLTWPNGADLDPEWVHEELGRSRVWVLPG